MINSGIIARIPKFQKGVSRPRCDAHLGKGLLQNGKQSSVSFLADNIIPALGILCHGESESDRDFFQVLQWM